jgi:hypothetical protein
MIDNRTGGMLTEGPRDADRPAIHYVAASDEVEPGLSAHYATERGVFLAPAALVAWVIALELLLPRLFADLGSLAASGGPAITVLLSSSAVFSALVLRAGEHPLVRLILAPYRLTLACATISAVAAGAVLAFKAHSVNEYWLVCAVVAVAAASILSIEAVRAPAAARDS